MARFLFVLFLLAVVLEGAVRKWFLPEYSNEVFIVKDILIGAVLIAILGEGTRPGILGRQRLLPWGILVALVILHAVISGWEFETAVGLRYYLAPLPLLYVVPALLRSIDDLERLCRWTVVVAILEGVLGAVQYMSPYDSPINTYVWGPDVAVFGGEHGDTSTEVRARVTGTFSFISTYAAFLGVAWVFAWLLLLSSRRRLDRGVAVVGLILISLNIGMNGSRGLVLLAGVTGLPLLVIALRRAGLLRGSIAAVVLTIAFSVLGMGFLEPFLITFERGDFGEASERTVALLMAPFATLDQIGFFGTGVGTTFLGFSQFGLAVGVEFDEIFIDRIGVELGVLGYAYMVGLKLFVMLATLKTYFLLRNNLILGVWALISVLIQVSSFWTIPFYNSVSAIGYFSAVGLAYWLRGLAIAESPTWPPPVRQRIALELVARKWP